MIQTRARLCRCSNRSARYMVKMLPVDISFILEKLGLPPARRLGEGVNSAVYQIDQNRILKISAHARPEIKLLQDFLDTLPRSGFSFEVPKIFESGEINGHSYTIEQLIPGAPLREVYPRLSEANQERCIRELFDLLDILHNIELPGLYGERLLGHQGLTDTSWGGFLRKKCLQALKVNGDGLRVDFADIDKVVELYLADVDRLPLAIKPAVVHGDLFFPNIMASPGGKIVGIIDFSDLTLAGDPIVDSVSLAIFTRENEGRNLINQLLLSRFGEEFTRLKRLYSAYYAFRFSGCKPNDPDTYKWCLQEFSRYIKSH